MLMINIVIPMAGRGSRFANVGYKMPKPLIDVHGRYMIEYVIQNIRPNQPYRFIFLCLKDHLDQYSLEQKLRSIEPNCVVIPVDHITEGPACTVLLAEKYINNDDELMIANSDQYVDIDINDYLARINKDSTDGLIMTMFANDKKWSFIRYNDAGLVTEVREKEVISNEATVGIYNFKHGIDFVKHAHRMIEDNERVNGEFYVAPVYNRMIKSGAKICFFNIGSVGNGMYGLGVPEDLINFLDNPLSLKVFK